VLVGGPRALLLELAHPLVAAAVARHSRFQADPVTRLARTLDVMGVIAFGSAAESAAAASGLWRLHDRISGPGPGGRTYGANDPDLLMWVHATLVETVLVVERRYLGLLDDAERELYYAETRLVGLAIGIPDDLLPPDLGSFQAYFASGVERLEVGATARDLARHILRPRVRVPVRQLALPARLFAAGAIEAATADLLPARIRDAYGLGSPVHGAASAGLAVGCALTRAVAPRLPAPLLRWMGEAGMAVLLGEAASVGV
jgi:uncharacterized protein (DUF2236 family)